MKHCCKDPVVYQKLNEDIKRWIWKTAPGVRESVGCPKKKIPSIYLQNISVDFFYNLMLTISDILIYLPEAPQKAVVSGCKCGVESVMKTRRRRSANQTTGHNRIIGGQRVEYKEPQTGTQMIKYPWLVALWNRDPYETIEMYKYPSWRGCGGTLVARNRHVSDV